MIHFPIILSGNVWIVPQFNSVTQSCPTLCDPVDCSTLASLSITNSWSLLKLMSIALVLPSNHLILCCPLLPPSVFPSIRVFQWDSFSHQVAKVLELQLQHQSFRWIFRVDFLQDGLVWSPCCPRDSQEPFPTPQFESISSSASVLSLLYGPTLTSILLEKPWLWLCRLLSAKWCFCFLIRCLGLS